MQQGRIRSRHGRPPGKKRRHELQVLAERDIMTTEQFEEWRAKEKEHDEAFMNAEHTLRCPCGTNAQSTIVGACDLGWIVTTKKRQVVRADCPKCASTYDHRLHLERTRNQRRKPN